MRILRRFMQVELIPPPGCYVALLLLIALALPLQGADRALTHSRANARDKSPIDQNSSIASVASSHGRRNALGFSAPVFIENKGQFDERVRFLVTGNGASIWITKAGIVFDFLRTKTQPPKSLSPLYAKVLPSGESTRIVFAQKFVNGAAANLEAAEPLPGTYNYFIGSDSSKWVTHVHAYREVVYHDLWRGIDLKLAANGRNLEEELIVHPGADLDDVHLAYEGIRGLKVAKDGSLKIQTEFSEMTETTPHLYEEISGRKWSIKGEFKLIGGNSYAFVTRHHNRAATLVVDPTLLYSTFLGGSAGFSCGNPPFGGCGVSENANGIAVDASGSAYVTGTTISSDFPTTVGVLQSTIAPDCCAFVTKLSPLGNQLIYSTFVGGTHFSNPNSNAIAVSEAGEAYITGVAGLGYPITANALEPIFNGGIFFTKLSAQGDALLYSTQIGRAAIAFARGNAIAVDPSGRAYIAGSVDNGYGLDVTPSAFQSAFPAQAARVAFLSVIDPTQTGRASLVYSTYLGSSGADEAFGVAVDAFGMTYLTGLANDPAFPVTPGAYQTTYAGGVDAFIAKINPNANWAASLIYATYLGASSEDVGSGIGVDAQGNAYVVGFTNSGKNSPLFPTTPGALQPNYAGGDSSGFVTKLNAAGNQLVYSTYHGGFQGAPTSIAVDAQGNAFVGGQTSGNFPVTADAFQPVYQGGTIFRNSDAFVSSFAPDGSLLYSSFLGGSAGGDGVNAIAIDSIGDAYVTGYTSSPNFPVTLDAFQPAINANGASGPADAFVAKLPLSSQQSLAISSVSPTHTGNVGTAHIRILGSGFHQGALVKLVGRTTIIANSSLVGSSGRIIDASFDFTGTLPGAYEVLVINSDGETAILGEGFEIQPGGVPQLIVSIVGHPAVATGHGPTAFTVVVSNIGNSDSNGVLVSLYGVPSEATLRALFEISSLNPGTSPQQGGTFSQSLVAPIVGQQQMPTLLLPVIPAGGSIALPFSLALSTLPALPPLQPPPPGSQNSATAPGTTVVPTIHITAIVSLLEKFCNFNDCRSDILGVLMKGLTGIGCVQSLLCPLLNAQIIAGNSLPPTIKVLDFTQLLGDAFLKAFLQCGLFALGLATDPVAVFLSDVALVISLVLDCEGSTAEVEDDLNVSVSRDPNDKQGIRGVEPGRWIPGIETLTYAIDFENEPTASAAAAHIVVSDVLDASVDPSTEISLNAAVLGNRPIALPGTFHPEVGLNHLTTTVDLRPAQPLLMTVEILFDPASRTLRWDFFAIDPPTGLPTSDPSLGLLLPGEGGTVIYSVHPKQGVATGTQIANQAVITFDTNPSLATPTWINTIDNTPPLSHVTALPTHESATDFTIQWSGNDIGAGIQDFSIFVSDNGGPFTPFQTNTTAASATFTGLLGHTYGFYSISRDLVGNVEPAKTVADTTTTISADAIPPTTVAIAAPPANANGWNNSNVSVNLTATDNPGGSGVQQISYSATGAQSIATTNIAGDLASALISNEGLTNFTFFAADVAGNVESPHNLAVKLDKTPPSITGSRTPQANANSWNNTDVSVSFACTDALSGLAAGSPPAATLVSSEGANQLVYGACQDLASNVASAAVSGISIDKTPPSITPSRSPSANANGWNNTNVTVSFACADALSGLAAGSPPAPTVLSNEGTNQQVSGICFDLAGNSASATAGGINIDKTPPSLSGLPAANCSLWPPNHKFVTIATISANDALSGLSLFNVTGASNEPMDLNDPDIIITGSGLQPRTVQLRADRLGTGTGRIYTLTTTANDLAGNVLTVTSTCTVPHDQGP